MAKTRYYVVWKGRRTGIFSSWDECSAQVIGFPDAAYKSFGSLDAAKAAFSATPKEYRGKPVTSQQWLFSTVKPVIPSICVDAACSGSPGPVEYRSVETQSGRQIFKQGPFQGGTNNIGEFLAIVHALAWMNESGKNWPIYTDSKTALSWLKSGKAKTTLRRSSLNEKLFELIVKAESWLDAHPNRNQVLKWDTELWGENPADFGRK
jgi:ribonuclease HI